MLKVDSRLPNFLNGKLYKRWQHVTPMFYDGAVIASRTGKNGENIQLIITKDERILYTEDSKVSDVIENGIKKTYVSVKNGDKTEGFMTTAPSDKLKNLLVLSARWISKYTIPQKVELRLNPHHPNAKVIISGKNSEEISLSASDKINRIVASDFDNSINPLPKNIRYDLATGYCREIQVSDSERLYQTAKNLGLTSSDTLGQNIRTIV